jgi:hypothetical protein
MLEQKIELLANAINNLAEAMCVRAQATNNLTSTITTPTQKKEEVETVPIKETKKAAAKPVETPAPVGEKAPEPAALKEVPAVTLEQVRKVLLDKRTAGKGAQVAALVRSYGVASLDKISEELFPELLEKAGAL